MKSDIYKIPESVSIDMNILDKVIDIYLTKLKREPVFILTDIMRGVCQTSYTDIDEIYKSYKKFVKRTDIEEVKLIVNPMDKDIDEHMFIDICKHANISCKNMMRAFVYYIYRHGEEKYKEIQKWKINSK